MILDTGTVYGARYHTVSPGWGAPWEEMTKWCVKTFGPVTGSIWADTTTPSVIPKPGERWYMNNSKFWFREQKDLEWFMLKWQ